ncbi:MAG: efflux RND transporter periplasmic adaptor subunit [Pseudomonadota bacterium]|nr:efflux RND transporter periplasmic adaptor subunit [Pseudomonadota bacterium]
MPTFIEVRAARGPLSRLLVSVLCLMLWGCGDGKNAQSTPPPPPAVTVAKPLKKVVTEWDEFTGRFVAVDTVDVRARVSGYLESVHFRDGEIVEKGQLLQIIDQRPFKIAVEQAQGQLDQAIAQLDLAKSDVERARPLAENRTMTEREFETREVRVREAQGSVAAARAQLDKAKLDLEWTRIVAPVAGRVSDNRVDVGNLIAGDSTLLTTIVSLNPIDFAFEGSEADYLKYTRLAKEGARKSSRDQANPVAVRLQDESDFRHYGRMEFVDNAMDPRSGTIRARARFDNTDQFLLPGMFGRLRLFGGNIDALLVPDAAIASDQANKIVFVVAADGTVATRVVKLGPIIDGLRVIRAGLNEDETVVIEGIQRARPGQKVTPEEGRISPPPPAPATTK